MAILGFFPQFFFSLFFSQFFSFHYFSFTSFSTILFIFFFSIFFFNSLSFFFHICQVKATIHPENKRSPYNFELEFPKDIMNNFM